ncbi:hypothetical protein BCR43DRAFT_493131 [Syncephalastrum racemosum]|uniref:NDT80 domain-containing protein n=1 Tax=Syncephalastrum racemosum TaxID=13706 RepID=A0A1X2HA25_SYNRA|nr:hypothetical protein BCR43DRAFT_493131 [Syncephalastrum racemosum]
MSSQPTTPRPSVSDTKEDPRADLPPPNLQPLQRPVDDPASNGTPAAPGPLSTPTATSSTITTATTATAATHSQPAPSYPLHEPSPKFGATKYLGNLVAVDRATVIEARIQSKFDRGFFIADNDWTCYRRNYFQVSAAFTLNNFPQVFYHPEADIPCLVRDENEELHDVRGFRMGISARLADDDSTTITLIQHTAKRDKGPQLTPEPKPVVPNGDLTLYQGASAGNPQDQSVVTFERIQFKSATANNGKRRAAQQYYILNVELFARLHNEQLIKVASNRSAPLVVRGRSPGHYSNTAASPTDERRPSRTTKSSASANGAGSTGGTVVASSTSAVSERESEESSSAAASAGPAAANAPTGGTLPPQPVEYHHHYAAYDSHPPYHQHPYVDAMRAHDRTASAPSSGAVHYDYKYAASLYRHGEHGAWMDHHQQHPQSHQQQQRNGGGEYTALAPPTPYYGYYQTPFQHQRTASGSLMTPTSPSVMYNLDQQSSTSSPYTRPGLQSTMSYPPYSQQRETVREEKKEENPVN